MKKRKPIAFINDVIAKFPDVSGDDEHMDCFDEPRIENHLGLDLVERYCEILVELKDGAVLTRHVDSKAEVVVELNISTDSFEMPTWSDETWDKVGHHSTPPTIAVMNRIFSGGFHQEEFYGRPISLPFTRFPQIRAHFGAHRPVHQDGTFEEWIVSIFLAITLVG